VEISPLMGYWSKCDHYFVFEHQASGLVLGGEIKSAATLNLMYHGLAFCLLEGLMRVFLAQLEKILIMLAIARQCNEILLVKDLLCFMIINEKSSFSYGDIVTDWI